MGGDMVDIAARLTRVVREPGPVQDISNLPKKKSD